MATVLKRRRNFHLLSGCCHEVFALRPNLVVDQQLEFQLLLGFADPLPDFAVHAGQRHALRPAQAETFAAQIKCVAEAHVNFGFNGHGLRAAASAAGGRFRRFHFRHRGLGQGFRQIRKGFRDDLFMARGFHSFGKFHNVRFQ